MTSKYGKYTVLDDMVLVEVTEELVDSTELKDLKKAEGMGLTIATDEMISRFSNPTQKSTSLKSEKIRKDVGTMLGRLVAHGSRAFEAIPTEHPGIDDVVLFKRYSGEELDRTDDAKVWFRLMNDRDLLAIVEKKTTEV